MTELRVGMLVRVGQHSNSKDDSTDTYTGRVGEITAYYGIYKQDKYWETDITPVEEGQEIIFAEPVLIPIKPDNEPCGSFEDMMNELNRPLEVVR